MGHEPIPDNLNAGEPGLAPGVERDLRELYAPRIAVPQFLDTAVLADAHRVLGRRRVFAGWGTRAALGLAAMLALAATIQFVAGHRPTTAGLGPTPRALAGDIDADGRVDIVDAMVLAAAVRLEPMGGAARDVNGDGVIDERDVEAVARLAVRLDVPVRTGGGA